MTANGLKVTGAVCFVVCAVLLFVAWERYEANARNVRAINLYFDDPHVTLGDAMPVLRRLQERGTPLILAKDVYQGFSLEEYDEILEGLSPRGLSVHLAAGSAEEGRQVMDAVRSRGETR